MTTETETPEDEAPTEDRSAFGQLFDMEESLNQIERMKDALMLIAEGEHASGHKKSSSGLYGIAFALEAAFDDLYERWDRACEAERQGGQQQA